MTACEVTGRVRVPRITFEYQSSRVFSVKQVSWKKLQENVEYVETPRPRASHPETPPETGTLSPPRHTSATLLSPVIPTCSRNEQTTAHRKEETQDNLGYTPRCHNLQRSEGFLEVTEFSVRGSHEKCSNGHKSTHVVSAFHHHALAHDTAGLPPTSRGGAAWDSNPHQS